MKLEGSHTFAAPRDSVWPMLLDPEVLASVLPGCRALEQIGDNEYRGVLNIRVGPVQGKFDGIVTLSEINPHEGYHLSVSGKGAPGFVKGSGSLELHSENGETVLRYEGTAQVGGRIASVGQRLLDTSAKAIIRQSLAGLDQQVQARMQAGSETASVVPITPTPQLSQTEFAAGVAKNMLEDMLPPEQRAALASKALPVLGAIVLVFIIDQWRMNRLARKVARMISKKGGAK
jgi:carbon monoxide dehydrogenase subunit G